MTTADFRPTHVVPQDGLPAWEVPDATRPTAPLDALLPVQLVDRLGDWGQVVCANGWSAWLDARLLIAVPADPPPAGRPLTRTADPRPLLTKTEDALGRYRLAMEDLATGTTQPESFRHRTRGLRVGVVVDGESVWLYDAEHERWVFCDGTRLSTYAVGAGPSSAAPEAAPAPGQASGRHGGDPDRPASAVSGGSGGAVGPEAGEAAAGPGRTPGASGGGPGGSGPGQAPNVSGGGLEGSGPPVGGDAGDLGPEATQVVDAVSGSDRVPDASGGDATRAVPSADGGSGDVAPEATRVVDAAAAPGPAPDASGGDGAVPSERGADGPEATQVVEDLAPAAYGREPAPPPRSNGDA
ncbi:hypothetical protein [Streptomyces sp. NPDC048436]|uniref:hypothetical protein n=1 Tax=Streptomyces sp. NPDC048436 TaxID=3365550 RepID=UPI0037229835